MHHQPGIMFNLCRIVQVIVNAVAIQCRRRKPEQHHLIDVQIHAPDRVVRCRQRDRRDIDVGDRHIGQILFLDQAWGVILADVMADRHQNDRPGTAGLLGHFHDLGPPHHGNAHQRCAVERDPPARPHPPFQRYWWQKTAPRRVAIGTKRRHRGNRLKRHPVPQRRQGITVLGCCPAVKQGCHQRRLPRGDVIGHGFGLPDPGLIIHPLPHMASATMLRSGGKGQARICADSVRAGASDG